MATCHMGNGSTIDRVIASTTLAGYIRSASTDTTVPFRPHDGIIIELFLPNPAPQFAITSGVRTPSYGLSLGKRSPLFRGRMR